MKKNKLLKVLSAAAIASSLAAVDLNVTNNTNSNFAYAADEASKVIEVPAHFMNHDKPEQYSMAEAAIGKVTVEKVANGYKYSVYLKDIQRGAFTGGLTQFWAEGNEVAIAPTTEITGSNPIVATFTLPELKNRIDAAVFVPIMEEIMPGGGKQPVYLDLDTSAAKAEFDKPVQSTKRVVVRHETIPFETERVENKNMPKGVQVTRQEGKNGSVDIVRDDIYEGDKLVKQGEEKQVNRVEPVKKIVMYGTKEGSTTPTTEAPKDHLAENVTVDGTSTATGSFQNASDNSKPSAYNAALVPEVKVEKVYNNYKYTFQVQPANMRGMSFELEAITRDGKELTMKEIDAVKKIKEVTLTTSELFDKLQLSGTVTYPNGMGRMTHPMTLVLKDFKKVEDNTKPAVPEKKEADYTLTSGKELKLARSTSSIKAYSDNTDVVELQDSFVTSISSSGIFIGHELKAIAKKAGTATVHIRNNNGEERLVTIKVVGEDSSNNSGNNNSGNNNSGNNNSGNNNSGNNNSGNNNSGNNNSGNNNSGNNNSGNNTNTNTNTITKYSEVRPSLMHAYDAGRASMGNAALDKEKTIIYKEGNTYHYTIFFHDLLFKGMTDGITKFWVNGSEVPVVKTGGANNEVAVSFTSTEKLTTLPVSVFVQTMENIMPGAGKQDAILTFDWSNAKEETTTTRPAQPSRTEVNPGTPTPTPGNQNPGNPTNQSANPTTPTVVPVPTADDIIADAQSSNSTMVDATVYNGVRASLMHAHEAGRASMGNAALDYVQVYKVGDTYHYVVFFKDLKVGSLSDGISRFWVNGVEYPVVATGGANNQVKVHFTSTEKLDQIPVSVYVQTMENIMPGGGKQDAILTFDWSNVTEEQTQVANEAVQTGTAANSSSALSPKGGRYNNGRLANTGLETSSSIFAGMLTLLAAFFLGRRKEK